MYCSNAECPDVERTGRSAEYRDGITECPVCGAVLSSGPPRAHESAVGETTLDGYRDFVSIGHLGSASAVRAAKALLEEAGIAHVVHDDPGRQFSPWPVAGGGDPFASSPELLVEPGYTEEVRSILQQIDAEVSEHEFPSGQQDSSDTSVSLMKSAEQRRERAKGSWLGRMFRSRPSVAKVILFGAGSISAATMGVIARGSGWFMAALLFAVLAWDNQRRLRKIGDQGFLPEQFLCPSCRTSVVLRPENRRGSTFTCPSCREEFEVTDE